MKWLLAPAVLLAIGMVAAGVTAGRTLRQRDAAVREGILLRTAHDLERQLREGGPSSADAILTSLIRRGEASAVELSSGETVLHRAGTPHGRPTDSPIFLGPAWRGIAPGFGMMPRGQSPFRLRVWPAAGAGDATGIAAVATWGAVAAAVALLAFAVVGARGIRAHQRAAALDAERQRLEVVSAAGAGLAHRIRNPLATIKATAQMLESGLAGTQRERAARIVDGSLRIETLVDELLTFARPVEVHAEAIELNQLAELIVPSVEHAGPVLVRADREHVIAAIEELLANAGHAGDTAPNVVVRREFDHGIIEVRDRGKGLQIDAARAFDPYVTTRADGTGLGLPTVRALIRANGGEVTLAPREGGGCVAAIVLPAVRT